LRRFYLGHQVWEVNKTIKLYGAPVDRVDVSKIADHLAQTY